MVAERRDYVALEWVAGEITETLAQSTAALKDYLSNRDDATKLRFCLTYIHQVYGTLKMVEFAGAALLAEEMEEVVQALLQHKISDFNRDDALLALQAALTRLPDYLKRLLADRRDAPTILLPLINDLRAVRGEPLITESAVFAPVFAPVAVTDVVPTLQGDELLDVAKKLRQMYQMALLNYLRNEAPRDNLNYLAKVCARLAKLSAGYPAEALWNICIALCEGLLNRSIQPTAAVKTLLRQIDSQLKLMVEQGSAALPLEPPSALIKNLLYYIAASDANSRYIGEIKQRYNLAQALLPTTDLNVGGGEEAARAIKAALAQQLAALAEDLSGGQTTAKTLAAVKRALDTTALLGMNAAQGSLRDLARQLQSGSVNIDAAASMLRQQAEGLELAQRPVPRTLFNDSEEAQEQLDKAFDAVMLESRNSLEQAKESIIEFVATQWRHQCLEDVPDLLAGVRGSFAVAGLHRAADVLAKCENYVRQDLLAERQIPAWQLLDTLADAIASIDYYVERLSDDAEAECQSILEVAEQSVRTLISAPAAERTQALAAISSAQILPFQRPVAAVDEPYYNDHDPEPVEETAIEAVEPPLPEQPPAAVIDEEPGADTAMADASDEDAPDAEIIEIFIEEAGEVLDTIHEQLPQWLANPTDSETLNVIRRAFHTLKGSGRMVGAIDIGELAWSIENMLNRVIDGSVFVDESRLDTVQDAIALIPAMVTAFKQNSPGPTVAAQAVGERALALSREQAPLAAAAAAPTLVESLDEQHHLAPNYPLTAEDHAAELAEATGAAEAAEADALLDIFASEAWTHIETIETFIRHAEQLAGPAELSDDLQRALHTLKGSAHMADVVPIAQVVTPVERFIKEMRTAQLRADAEVLAVLREGVALFRAGLDQLATDPHRTMPGAAEFVEWVDTLHHTYLAHVDDQPEASTQSISPAAFNQFLGDAIELLSAVGEDLQRWQDGRLDDQRQHTLAGTINQVADSADALNLNTVVELAQALQALLRRGADSVVDGRFFDVALRAVDALIDMLDCLAANQNTADCSDLQNELTEFEFATRLAEAELTSAIDIPVLDDVVGMDDASISTEHELSDLDFSESSDTAERADELSAATAEFNHAWSEPDDVEVADGAFSFDDYDLDEPTASDNAPVATELGPDEGEAAFSEFATEIGNDAPATADLELVSPEAADAPNAPEPTAEELLAELIEEHLPDNELTDAASEPGLASSEDDLLSAEQFEFAEHDFDAIAAAAAELPPDFGAAATETVDSESDDDFEAMADATTVNTPLSGEPVPTPFMPMPIPTAAMAVDQGDDDDEIDIEILEIFLEEAGDLLEAIDEAIHHWGDDRRNGFYLDDLQRLLHTLKGGARLAGLKNLGNLSHNFETFLINVQQQQRPIDDALLTEVHGYQDQLIKLIEAVKVDGHSADQALNAAVAISPAADEPATESTVTVNAGMTPDPLEDLVGELMTDVESPRPPTSAPDLGREQNVVPFMRPGGEPSPFQPPTPRHADELDLAGVSQQMRRGPQEVVKISSQLLEQLVNLAGETSIARARSEEQVNEFVFSLDEMQITVDRLHEQVRRLDLETEAQMLFRQEQVESEGLEGFDPLEFDRYSLLQQLSRSLLESASDLVDIKNTLAEKSRDMETLLVQQSRINTELQEGLMRSRMVPFARMVPRLRRIVRQVAGELDRQVDFYVDNAEGELDRTVLERVVAPLEHMLRNAIDHGIEPAAERIAAGKSANGTVILSLAREGGEVVLRLADDGRGIDLNAVREKAIARDMMAPNAPLSDHEIMQFILQPGFSTAKQVTQISGRGVGMDVVYSEIKQLGGSLEIDSSWGKGSQFTIRLPFTVSVNRALMVNVSGDIYAIPLNSIEGIVRVSPFELEAYYQPDAPLFEYAGQPYLMRYMGALLRSGDKPNLEGITMPLPVLLVRGSDHSVAVQVDSLMGSREIVVKTLGPQFGLVQGLSGATVLGDGSVVVILDLMALIRADALLLHRDAAPSLEDTGSERTRPLLVMVVDDSVTVRKVTSRFLERQGMEVMLAKDGVDAINLLQEAEQLPDVMLLDIEMPRMDGFEVASRVRHTSRLQDIPIIMITSRTGEKHRERAFSLGVNRYLGKPYQEMVLLDTIQELIGTTVPQ